MNEDNFYNNIYTELQSKGLQGWFHSKSHKSLENKIVNRNAKEKSPFILEVGGNIGEHIKYVRSSFAKYLLTDLREINFISNDSRVSFECFNVQHIPYPDNTFDRVICTCLLHHVENLNLALKEMLRVTKKDGTISILLPCDPGLVYRVAKVIGPNRVWRKHGILNPSFFHYSQHRNHFPGIKSSIKEIYFNEKIHWKYWPLKFSSWNLNMFTVVTIEKLSNK